MNSFSRRILCVDDDHDSCEIMSLMLHDANVNYRVTTVSSGNKALSLIADEPFDLYILDYRLPEMSGIELCRLIRQTDAETPIMFFTGMAREIDGKNAIEAGATKFLVKPTDLDILTETVEKLLNQSSFAFPVKLSAGNQ
ncbi:MAG: response regulator [Pyrinomonadaceae bacterium]